MEGEPATALCHHLCPLRGQIQCIGTVAHSYSVGSPSTYFMDESSVFKVLRPTVMDWGCPSFIGPRAWRKPEESNPYPYGHHACFQDKLLSAERRLPSLRCSTTYTIGLGLSTLLGRFLGNLYRGSISIGTKTIANPHFLTKVSIDPLK